MEQAPCPGAPPGYRFAPTPRELILYYLNPWVASPAGQTPFGQTEGIVCAADVYSADPGTLTSGLRHFGHDDGNWYFLCVARWKDGNAGTRMSRAVQGGGTWHGSGKRIPVGRHGYRQTFEYRVPGGGKSAWLMEEIGSSLPEATGGEGVKVLCRVHRTPRAAADDDANEERQETDEVVQFRSSKKPRCELRQEHDFAAANYWAAAAPTDVVCSYASTSQTALVNAAAPTTWQQQPMMEQGVASYHCTGVNGGVYVKDEQQPLEVLLPDEGWQQCLEIDYGFDYSTEDGLFKKNSTGDAQLNDELMHNTFSCPKPSDGAVRENGDPRGERRAS
ncbi:NAC domain-containing protein 26 [Setaria italica]|nr:NAC domain-containing protein 26 [Setaria italica]